MAKVTAVLALLFSFSLGSVTLAQQSSGLTLRVREHRFEPRVLIAPANVPIELHIQNVDSTPMEFESVSLRVEKSIVGNGQGIIRLRPLSPGRYNFFDDFHQETTGVLVVQ